MLVKAKLTRDKRGAISLDAGTIEGTQASARKRFVFGRSQSMNQRGKGYG